MGNTYYSKKGIRGLRKYRRTIKSPFPSVSDRDYQKALGDLMAAGHIQFTNLKSYETETVELTDKDTFNSKNLTKHKLEFHSQHNHTGDDPHFRGYLQSGNESDPMYRVKGWLNQHGDDVVIRLELVSRDEED